MRLGLCLPAALFVLAACAGGGGDGDERLSLSPTSGSPGSALTVRPVCDEPPLVTEWLAPSGFSSLVASTDAQSEHGLTSVPGDAAPGTYTVVVTCANNPQPVGEANFDVTG